MAKLILPKATTATRTAATPVAGEILYDTDQNKFYGGDGATQGGVPFALAKTYDGFVYGIDYDTSVATAASACTKIVLNTEHDIADDPLRYTGVASFTRLPAHNWKRCVVTPATRTVNYYLHPSDSSKKANGQAATLTGADGDVMVEIPVTHYRIDKYTDSSEHEHIVWLVSDQPFSGSAPHPFFYTSPDGATLRTQYVGAFPPIGFTASGSSFVPSADYAVGGAFKSIHSTDYKPPTGWSLDSYLRGTERVNAYPVNITFAWFLRLMMVVEYGTFDIQSAFSAGFTGVDPSAVLATAKRYNGRTIPLGNGSGHILADDDGDDEDIAAYWQSGVTSKVVACSYRGVEDPFGLAWAICAGCITGDNSSIPGYWITNSTSRYGDIFTGPPTSLTLANLPSPSEASVFNGYTGDAWIFIPHGWAANSDSNFSLYPAVFDPLTFLPLSSETSGSSSTYLCDASLLKGALNPTPTLIGYGDTYDSGAAGGPFSSTTNFGMSGTRIYSRTAC